MVKAFAYYILQLNVVATIYFTTRFTAATVQGQPLFKGGRNMVLTWYVPSLLLVHALILCVHVIQDIRDLTDSMTCLL